MLDHEHMIALLTVVAVGAAGAFYELPVTRDGATVTRVAANAWLGEYPDPVIVLGAEMTVQAYDSVRKLEAPKACTVAKGIYHPWSKEPGSTAGFFTLAPVYSYTATADNASFSGAKLKKDDVVTDVVPLAEGACYGMHKKKPIEFQCDELDHGFSTKTQLGKDKFQEQWVHMSCKEGHKAFILDTALLGTKGVKRGQVVSYGKVSP